MREEAEKNIDIVLEMFFDGKSYENISKSTGLNASTVGGIMSLYRYLVVSGFRSSIAEKHNVSRLQLLEMMNCL